MVFRNFVLNTSLRVISITLNIFLFFLSLYFNFFITAILLSLFIPVQTVLLIKYVQKSNSYISYFFDSVNNLDFDPLPSLEKNTSFKRLIKSLNKIKAELKRHRFEDEKELAHLRTILDKANLGLILFNNDNSINYINKEKKKLLNINSSDFMKEIENKHNDLFKSIMNGEENTSNLAGNKYIYSRLSRFVIDGKNYKLIYLHNIRKELIETELNAWNKLLRVLTHEIMNSITPISSLAGTSAKIIKDLDDKIPKDLKESINLINHRCKGLLYFVEQYRKILKVPKPVKELISVSEIFAHVQNLYNDDIKKKNITFEITQYENTIFVNADKYLLEQVMMNLVKNSIEALDKTAKPTIEISAYKDNKQNTVLKISDNGPGISDDIIEKVFVPFFSTKKSGLGIGLSFSNQVMKLHGGSIRIISQPGSTVILLTFML